MRLRKISVWLSLASLAIVTASGCSDDDDDSSDGRGGTSSTAGTSSNGGAGAVGGEPAVAGSVGNPAGGNPTSVGGEPGSSLAGAGTTGSAGEGGAGGASEVLALSDAQILLVLDTLNAGEVEEAYAVLPRLSDTDVEAFAQKMILHHGSARQDVAATAETLSLSPEPSPKAAELEGEGKAHVALLRATSKASLDATYIQLEVSAHAEALKLLQDLGDVADEAALTSLIATLQTTVQEHYDEALELEAQLP